MSTYHKPVLLSESIDALDIKESGVYVDVTLGGGGHTKEILSRLGKKGKLLVFDQDSDAIKNAPKDNRVLIAHSNFRFIHNFVKYYQLGEVDGILADLGVSSHQFDTSERGFSFRFDSPLDMRMNTNAAKSAKDVINGYSEDELIKIFRLYGEVDHPAKAARYIVQVREQSPIITTTQLTQALSPLLPHFAEHKYLAKIYQALRIEVNGEMDSLGYFLKGAEKSLKVGGRLSIITYHSLEDRIVKNYIKSGNTDGIQEKDFYGRVSIPFINITKKPVLPKESEISENTRARSAKLRIGEKV
jgi:16S rRNA (cytosine1402-N4)-methyltransferase